MPNAYDSSITLFTLLILLALLAYNWQGRGVRLWLIPGLFISSVMLWLPALYLGVGCFGP